MLIGVIACISAVVRMIKWVGKTWTVSTCQAQSHARTLFAFHSTDILGKERLLAV